MVGVSDLLPNTEIELSHKRVGCALSADIVDEALQDLYKELPDMAAVIGPQCSNDVQAASEWLLRENRTTTTISPISSAPQLADEIRYPNVARFATSEEVFQKGTPPFKC